MQAYDWTQFARRIDTKASVETVYKAISTPAGFECWFLRLAEFTTLTGRLRRKHEALEKGDTYRWLWHGYADETEEKGTILNANGQDTVEFTFAGSCTVTITVSKEQGETIITLCQKNIPVDEKSKANWHLGCSTGWTFYLANLKSVLEGGLDLRNKDEMLKNVVNA
jgi:uncharacterized protein YndB with AHSA1/START domain